MRRTYPYHYPWSDEQFGALWKDALFVFDASSLLNIYTFSERAREQIIDVIDNLRPNIWIPYQFGLEYQRNRIKVIRRSLNDYKNAKRSLDESKTATINALGGFSANRFVMADVSAPLAEAFDARIKLVSEAHDRQEKLLKEDPYHARLTELFEGNVGRCSPTKELHDLFDMARKRFAHWIPPGYEDLDKEKDKLHPYGDYLGWHQMVQHAKKRQCHVVLVSDDRKPDWWSNESVGAPRPRPELRTEFHEAVGREFYMYRLHQFIQEAERQGRGRVAAQALAEAKENEKRESDDHEGVDPSEPTKSKKTAEEQDFAVRKKITTPAAAPKKVPAEGKKTKPGASEGG